MRFMNRQWLFISVLVVTIGAALPVFMPDNAGRHDRPGIDLALVQDVLNSSRQTAVYRWIPESIMSGLCWRTADGTRAGLFKDAYAGLAQWREHMRPAWSGSTTGTPGVVGQGIERIDYARLAQGLDRLSFTATGYNTNGQAAEISGILTIAETGRRVALTVTIPEKHQHEARRDVIELNASAPLAAAGFGDTLTSIAERSPQLCIAMQAVAEARLPAGKPDQPVMLGHYY